MALVTVNIWTGAPLLAVWLGSRVAPDSGLSMGAVAVVAISLTLMCLVLVRLLTVLTVRYDAVVGRPPRPREQSPWMRSMRGERPHAHPGEDEGRLRAQDYVLVGSVALAWLAFEVWFFFFAGSSIGQA